MSIVVVGFLAYDTVETPNGKVEEVLGGGASYFAIAARFFSPVSIVAVVGSDFKAEDMRLFTDRNIDVRGVAKRERARLFRSWFWQTRHMPVNCVERNLEPRIFVDRTPAGET